MGFYSGRVLPYVLDLAMGNAELAPYRERTVSAARGVVLEIGIGSGLNGAYYTERASALVGVEPHPKMLAKAQRRSYPIPVALVRGAAEALPLPAGSVDTVVTTWTLCSLADVAEGLREMRRVLKPGGQLLFVEHGLAREESVRRWQDRLTPLWKRIGGGCHLNRPIAELIGRAGFEITGIETGYVKGPKPMTFTYQGCARAV